MEVARQELLIKRVQVEQEATILVQQDQERGVLLAR